MEKRFHGLKAKDVKKMSGMRLPNPFTEKNHSARWRWLRSFMKRHPQLNFRRPKELRRNRTDNCTTQKRKVLAFKGKPSWRSIFAERGSLVTVGIIFHRSLSFPGFNGSIAVCIIQVRFKWIAFYNGLKNNFSQT
nr:unnamed protein product [Callosobruchus analis]